MNLVIKGNAAVRRGCDCSAGLVKDILLEIVPAETGLKGPPEAPSGPPFNPYLDRFNHIGVTQKQNIQIKTSHENI